MALTQVRAGGSPVERAERGRCVYRLAPRNVALVEPGKRTGSCGGTEDRSCQADRFQAWMAG